jgi:hypothetical protein
LKLFRCTCSGGRFVRGPEFLFKQKMSVWDDELGKKKRKRKRKKGKPAGKKEPTQVANVFFFGPLTDRRK